MRLRIYFFAALRERAGADELALDDLPESLDLAGLKRELERRHPELGSLAHVRGVLREAYVPDQTPLCDGWDVHLLPPVSGGAPERGQDLERGVFELHAKPLDPALAQVRVGDPACGAVVCFTGTTRARNRDQDVVRLDYEAFAAMAAKEMARVYADCVARFGPPSWSAAEGAGTGPAERMLRMLTLHRTGVVEVGEPSVVIAVASPHRDAAFGACRFLIDELKKRLPLWKREVYADGQHWIGDRS